MSLCDPRLRVGQHVPDRLAALAVADSDRLPDSQLHIARTADRTHVTGGYHRGCRRRSGLGDTRPQAGLRQTSRCVWLPHEVVWCESSAKAPQVGHVGRAPARAVTSWPRPCSAVTAVRSRRPSVGIESSTGKRRLQCHQSETARCSLLNTMRFRATQGMGCSESTTRHGGRVHRMRRGGGEGSGINPGASPPKLLLALVDYRPDLHAPVAHASTGRRPCPA